MLRQHRRRDGSLAEVKQRQVRLLVHPPACAYCHRKRSLRMNLVKQVLLGLGMLYSLIGISKAENLELNKPEFSNVPSVTINKSDFKKQTEDITYVTVPVTLDANQNALNLEEAGRTPSTGKLIVNLPNAEYDKNGIQSIIVSFRDNVNYRATSSPIPTLIGHINDFPTTGAFIRDQLYLGSSMTLENLIFYANKDASFNYLSLNSRDYLIKNCYFRGDGTINQRGITIARSGGGNNIMVEHCLFTSFTYGSEINTTNTKWRKNIFKNNRSGWVGTASADYGTTSSPGNNLFYKNRVFIVEIGGGNGYPMQWGYFYNKDGTQLTKLEDILPLIKDWRTSPTPSPALMKTPGKFPEKMNVGSDVLIEPFYRTRHPLIPAPASVRHWEIYR